MSESLGFRLVIRNEDDSADALIVSSVPDGANPYLTDPPQVDGASADLIAGTVDVGAATIRLWDEFIDSAAARLVVDDFDYADDTALHAVWTPTGASAPSVADHPGQVATGSIPNGDAGPSTITRTFATGAPDTTVEVRIWLRREAWISGPLAHDATIYAEAAGARGATSEISGWYMDPPFGGTLTDEEPVVVWGPLSRIDLHGVQTFADGTLDVTLGLTDYINDIGYSVSRQTTWARVEIWTASQAAGYLFTRELYALKDTVARLTQLSRRARIEQTTDGGATWVAFHRGYLNRCEVEGGEWTVTVGDTTRQEQQTELFATLPQLDPASLDDPLPMPAPRVGLILGGPVAADPTYGKFAAIDDYGPCRFQVDEQHSDQGPDGTTRVLRLKFKSGYLRPWYDTSRTKFQEDEWNTVNGAVQPYFQWDPYQFASPASATVNYYGYFPDLIAQLTPVGGGTVLEATPIARPVGWQLPFGLGDENRLHPSAEYDALVGNDSTIYLYWGDQPWPGIGAQFDVTVFSRRIDDGNPVLLAGHPVDLVAYAAALAGVPIDADSRASCKAALGDGLWFEGMVTKQKLADFVKMLAGACRFLLRPDVVTGDRQFVPIGPRPASSFAVTSADRLSASDDGASQPTIFAAAEDSVVNVVTFETQRFRRYKYKTDSGDVPIHMIATAKATLEGTRGDMTVNGERTVTYTLPGQLMLRAADGTLAPQPQAYYEDIGGVLVDFAGWGVPQTVVLVDAGSDAAGAQVGDEGTIDLPDLPTPDSAGPPYGTRGGGPRVVRVVKRTPQIGAVEFTYAHAGELSQSAVAAPSSGGSTDAGTPLAPTISLAASATTPTTVVTVTLTNGAALSVDNLRTELESLVQTTMPTADDPGDAFGPVTSYPDGDATMINTPSVAPGSQVWVRARSVNGRTEKASAWTTWASLTLGTVTNGGATADERPYAPATPQIAATIDGSGVVSATVTAPGATSVKLVASTSGVPTDAAVRAGTADSSAPFTFASVVTLTSGQTAYLAAYAYDAVGNESAKAVVTVPYPSSGAPVGAQYLVGASDATLTAERVVTDTTTVAWDLATAGQAKANVPDGSLGLAKLSATGTRSSSTYLRGDNTWATPSGGGSGTGPWETLTPPVDANFAWVNQGSATVDATAARISVASQGTAGTFHLRKDATAFGSGKTLIAATVPSLYPGTTASLGGICGPVVFDASGRFHFMGIYYRQPASGGVRFVSNRWSSATVYGGTDDLDIPGFLASSLLWWKIQDTGTNLVFSYSLTGVAQDYMVLLTLSRTAFLVGGPTAVGFGVADVKPSAIAVYSWSIT